METPPLQWVCDILGGCVQVSVKLVSSEYRYRPSFVEPLEIVHLFLWLCWVYWLSCKVVLEQLCYNLLHPFQP